jgi:hypothetical protein
LRGKAGEDVGDTKEKAGNGGEKNRGSDNN